IRDQACAYGTGCRLRPKGPGMSIRTRLTLWYTGFLLASLVVMAFVLHYEITEQQAARNAQTPPEPAWEEVGEILLYYGGPTAMLLLLGGWFLMRRSLAPVATLTRAAERIHPHNLRERLASTGTGDELDRLTEVFNAMMARLEDSFARIREFTLHAS